MILCCVPQLIDASHQICSLRELIALRANMLTSSTDSTRGRNISSSRVSSRSEHTKSRFKSIGNPIAPSKQNSNSCESNHKVILTLSAGLCGARNAKKSALVDPLIHAFVTKTPIRSFAVEVRGFSTIRESFLQSLIGTQTIKVTSLVDTTAVPHNGCRRPSRRRL